MYERLLEVRKIVSDRDRCNGLISKQYPVELTKSWTTEHCHIAEGHFTSPLAQHFPGLLPKESEKACFQIIVPKKWPQQGRKPLCLHLAGTGDHHFWRRRNMMAKPLAKNYGIASVLLENPFYGVRKPNNQVRSSLRYVVDLFIMGAALILESLVLLQWGERQGYGPLGITGISMGGHMASLACTAWPKPLAIVPCLSWSTASCVFTQGVMSKACSWSTLENELLDDVYRNKLLNCVAINGVGFTKFDEETYSEKLIQSSLFNSSSQYFLKYQRKNLDQDEIRFQTLYLQHEDVCNGLKQTVFNDLPSVLSRLRVWDSSLPRTKAIDFMNFVMDEATHLKHFPKPVDCSLVQFVIAKHDAYVPRDNVMSPSEIWPGCKLDYISTGHIMASLNQLSVFRKAIKLSMDQLK